MKPTTVSLTLLVLVASTVSIAAQTVSPKPATTPVAITTHKTVSATSSKLGGCAKLPTVSDKIPSLPATADCVKPLYTLTRKPDVIVDYASPMVSPELREALGAQPISISLLYVDTKIGSGAVAKPHYFYSVHYTGYLPDGTKFDSSVDRGEPITFQYGAHNVIPGWDTGFEGMHVGGKRRLFVPFQLAYGEKGHPPVIPAKAELIFDLELVAQSETQPAPKPAPAPPTTPTGTATPAPSGAAPAATVQPATTEPNKK